MKPLPVGTRLELIARVPRRDPADPRRLVWLEPGDAVTVVGVGEFAGGPEYAVRDAAGQRWERVTWAVVAPVAGAVPAAEVGYADLFGV